MGDSGAPMGWPPPARNPVPDPIPAPNPNLNAHPNPPTPPPMQAPSARPGLAVRVRPLLDEAARTYRGRPGERTLASVAAHLDGPLRVALVGRVTAASSRKSMTASTESRLCMVRAIAIRRADPKDGQPWS